ncbi:cytochrome c oxidase assembly protein subunit 15 [Pedococcus dokdonensis]|uniref:Cytochrome c oxidase assembly protein subunit 15 n=1 Tax=Pedococcus dokdonensis TaxID=443156 RepID=A0A1H0P5H0_9MICO|nr:COX15/CtaA family protein [Pedococcus dokdonensis]SDO99946.1 cytochrome c oxidase assembly protein subunit 15 [Pedococcus dokdonensis]
MTTAPAPTSATAVAEPTTRTGWLPRILLANLVVEVLIVVTGGLVRLTGSGLGCPTWPECVPGSYTPVPHQAEGWHRYIEFGNRTLTSVVSIAAIASVYAVWRWAARRRDLLVPAIGVLAGVGVQAVLGGITVRTGLNPVTVAAHFLVSMCLVAASAYLVFRAPEPAGPRALTVHPLVERLGWATCAVAAVVLLLGTVVTGSGPHSGDADEPARFGFDPRTISWLHADAVMLFVGLVVAVWIASRLTASTARPGRAWAAVFAVTIAQGVVGYTQYLTGLPWVVVLVHMLLATLLVVALTRAMVALRSSAPR